MVCHVSCTYAYFQVKEWDTGNSSEYADLYEAALAGEDISGAVKELTDNGKTEKEVLSELKSQIGKWYYDPERDKVRVKNPVFWVQIAGAIVLPILAYRGPSWEDMASWAAFRGIFLEAVRIP